MIENTIWKTIISYENYEVSTAGEIRNKKSGRILKPSRGHASDSVTLYNSTSFKAIRVHEVVADTFLIKPINAIRLIHKNKDRRDNRVDNLEWLIPPPKRVKEKVSKEKECLPDCDTWKTISNYLNYQVSSEGQVRNRKTGNILVPIPASRRYRVSLRNKTIAKLIYIHQLVSEAFLIKPENATKIQHINSDTLDNRADNLKWITQKTKKEKTVRERVIREKKIKPPTPVKPPEASKPTKMVKPAKFKLPVGWTLIPGFTGYATDREGQIRSLKTGKLLKPIS